MLCERSLSFGWLLMGANEGGSVKQKSSVNVHLRSTNACHYDHILPTPVVRLCKAKKHSASYRRFACIEIGAGHPFQPNRVRTYRFRGFPRSHRNDHSGSPIQLTEDEGANIRLQSPDQSIGLYVKLRIHIAWPDTVKLSSCG